MWGGIILFKVYIFALVSLCKELDFIYGDKFTDKSFKRSDNIISDDNIEKLNIENETIPLLFSDISLIKNDTNVNNNLIYEKLKLVNVISEETLEKLLDENDFLMIIFTAPWCGMSKRALGQINEMIEYIDNIKTELVNNSIDLFSSKKITIGLINVPEYPNLTKRLNVSDYPTIKLLRKDGKIRIIDYYGNIHYKKVLSWLIKQVRKQDNNVDFNLLKLKDIKSIKLFVEINDYSIIYFYRSGIDKYKKNEHQIIIDICKVYDDIIFGKINIDELTIIPKNEEKEDNFRKELIYYLNNKEKSSILLLFNSGRLVKSIYGPFKDEGLILNIIDYYKQEKVIFLNNDTIGDIINRERTILLLIFNGNSDNYVNELKKETSLIYQFYNILKKVLSIRNEKTKDNKYYEKEPLFVISGNEGPINRRFMDYLHIDDDLLPSILIVKELNTSPPKKYYLDLPKIYLNKKNNNEPLSLSKASDSNWIVLNNNTSINFSPSIISDFIDEVKMGLVNNTYYSQSIPIKQNGPVYVIVGDSFKDIVHNQNKDVLVLFYTPWCGHCKIFDPIYNEVANIVASKTSILIAKIDMSKNFVPIELIGSKIFRFPTIKLFKKKDKNNPIDFDGERETNSILDFIWIHTARDEL